MGKQQEKKSFKTEEFHEDHFSMINKKEWKLTFNISSNA